jgi:hypothetical protein
MRKTVLQLAETELRCPVSACGDVKDGETRACFGKVRQMNGDCLFVDDVIRLVVLEPCPSCLDGCLVAVGAATRRQDVLIASGLRVLEETSNHHVIDMEGWVLARSERQASDGSFWIKFRFEEEQDENCKAKRSRVDDEDDLFDLYDAEYGYNQEMEEETKEHFVDFVVSVSHSASWGLCAPGCKVGLWGAQKSYASNDVQMTARGAVLLNGCASKELMEERICYCGEVTSVVSAGHIVLDNDLPCLLAVSRTDLLVGMQVQVWHAHPVWDGPALVLCPFSSLVVVAFSSPASRGVQVPLLPCLPSFCASLPVWSRVWLTFAAGKVPATKHAVHALLLSLGPNQPLIVASSAAHFGAHSYLVCPFYSPEVRVPEAPEVLSWLSQPPTRVAPYPFAYSGAGQFVLMRGSDDVTPVSLERARVLRGAARGPRRWLLCVVASE